IARPAKSVLLHLSIAGTGVPPVPYMVRPAQLATFHRCQGPSQHDAVFAPALTGKQGPVRNSEQFLPVPGISGHSGDTVAGGDPDIQSFIIQEAGVVELLPEAPGQLQGLGLGTM